MPKLTRDERVAWLRAVWSTFQERAGTARDMTNAEYHLAASWLDSGIPLFVVCRALKDFEGTPRRLEAVRVPVDKAVAYWRQAIGGER